MTEALLRVENLSIDYLTDAGALRAVDGVSFELEANGILGLAGESGCGKSTIAQAILRILRPPGVITSGKILFAGRDVLRMSAEELRAFRWRDAAMVFQSALNSLNPVLRIEEQICDVLHAHSRIERRVARDEAAKLLELVGLPTGTLERYPHQLSGGMRQRVGIAIAVALRPQLLIMDEPTTALDVVVQREILDNIARLQQELGFAVLFITHDLEVLFSFCHQLAVLYAGRIVEFGPIRAFEQQARHPYTAGLLRSFPTLAGPRVRLEGIPGSAAPLGAWSQGCAFSPRCARATEHCERAPELQSCSEGHRVACHHRLGGEA